MKVAYLFTSYRAGVVEKYKKGEDHGSGFWGMFWLPEAGVESWYIEPEQIYSKKVSEFIRKRLGVYWLHLSVFWKFFSYDFVFTSTAFGTQLFFTLLPGKPRWVMHDFSITGLVGEGKTLKQKMFRYLVKHAAGVVTLAEAEKEKLEKMFPHLVGRIEYIPFGTNFDFFKPKDVPEAREIFVPGRDPDRDYTTLFTAVKDLNAPVIVTTHVSRLKKFDPLPSFVQVRDLSIKEYVDTYARASVIMVPLDTSSGLNDAMGSSVLFEAMAMGKAIVATGTHTMKSYITDGENGLLVPEKDEVAMHHALERLLNDQVLRERLGKNARAFAEENLDAKILAARLAEFFKRLG